MPLNTRSPLLPFGLKQNWEVLHCTAARSSSNQSSLQDRNAPIPELLLPPLQLPGCALAVWEVLQGSACGLALGRSEGDLKGAPIWSMGSSR